MISERRTAYSELLCEKYEILRLSCGVTLNLFPKKTSSTVAMISADFGAMDRRLQNGELLPAGVAHFLEHKLFTNEDGSDSFERFSALGADANAFTSVKRTVYYFSAAEHFDECFRELLTFVMHPAFTEESVQRERGIIAEEILQTLDDPYSTVYRNMLKGLYGEQPITEEICGTLESIGQITPAVLMQAYESYYAPSNLTIAVCGDIDTDAVLRITQECFSHLSCREKLPREGFETAKTAEKASLTATGAVGVPTFCIGVKDLVVERDPQRRMQREAAMNVLCEMLFSGSGELYDQLLRQGLITSDLSAEYHQSTTHAYLCISGDSEDPERLFGEICAFLEAQKRTGLSPEGFERARRVEYAEYIKAFDCAEEIANVILSFSQEGTDPFAYPAQLQALSLSALEALLDSFFDPSCFTCSVMYPKKEQEDLL